MYFALNVEDIWIAESKAVKTFLSMDHEILFWYSDSRFKMRFFHLFLERLSPWVHFAFGNSWWLFAVDIFDVLLYGGVIWRNVHQDKLLFTSTALFQFTLHFGVSSQNMSALGNIF